jgi:hypothetical protein
MDFSDTTYLWLFGGIALPVALVLAIDFALRKRGAPLQGWTSAVLIAGCWIAGIVLILRRVV